MAGVFTTTNISAQESKTHFDNKPYIEGEMLVQVKKGKSIKDVLYKMPGYCNVKLNRLLSNPMRIWLIDFDHNAVSHEQMQGMLYEMDAVSVVDYNYKIQMRATTPNDANFNSQWHHVNTGQTGGTADADIDSDLAWDITTGGQTATNDDIVVCVIESGNLDHNDLAPNRWRNLNEIPNNGIDDDNNGYVDDYDGWNPVQNNDNYGTGGHGTNCLGMIGAKGNNGTLVSGINWDVKLMVVGDYSISTQANAIEAYTYPLEMRQIWNNSNGAQGAFVVATSSSWGIDQGNPNNYPLWCSFYDTLGKYGILNIGATTNSNLDVDAVGDMPTACGSPYMVGVGRTDHNDNTAGGYGATTIELGAPGINVVTTANTNTTTTTTGTSFSCPLTAGMVGLAYSIPCPNFMTLVKADPQQGADLVLQALLNGVDVKASLTNKFVTNGRLNAKNTLDLLIGQTCSGTLCLAPSSIASSNITGTSADITWTNYSGATNNYLFYKESSASTYTQITTTSQSQTLSGLLPCTSYDFYMQSVCGSDSSSTSSVQTFITTGCGNCVDLSYCDNNATDAVDEWIDEITIDTWTNNTGNDNGYGDYTNGGATVLSLDLNQTYSLTLTPAWGGTQYDEYFRLWIDLDQSGTFDAGELLYDQGAATQTAATGSITIPNTATLGNTRMRVQMAYQGNGQNTLPGECGSFQWGEVEDYCVEIIQSVICGFNVTNTVVDPDCNDLDNGSIAVSVSGGTPGYTYDWGTAGGNVSSLSNLSDGAYSVVITDGAGCDTTINYTLNYSSTLALSVSGNDVSCNGLADGSATASASGSSGYSYAWSNNGTTATINGLSGGSYSVTVTDGVGCTATDNLTINEPAAVSASYNEVVNGLTINFTNTSSPGSYLWDFGDGNTSTQTSPSHTYAAPGGYTICLTVTSGNCGADTTCKVIPVEGSNSVGENIQLFELYPNPTSDIINLQGVPSSIVSIELTDALGKIVSVHKATENMIIDLTDVANGTYYLIARTNKGVIESNSKVIVQH